MDGIFFGAGAGFLAGWGAKYAAELLKEHSSRPGGVDQLLNYERAVPGEEAAGIIQLKDGAFLASYRLKGIDLTSASSARRERLSYQINRWLKEYGDGFAFYFTNRRFPEARYPTGHHYSAAAAEIIDRQRKDLYSQKGKYFRSELYLSVIHMPDGTPGAEEGAEIFKKKLEELEDFVGTLLGLEILPLPRHLSYLYDCINFLPQSISTEGTDLSLDTVLASQDLVAGFKPRIGKKHFQAINITGFPASTYQGVLEDLDKIGGEIRWTTRVVTMDKAMQRKIINRKRAGLDLAGKDFGLGVTKKQEKTELDQEFEKAYADDSILSRIKDGTQALSKTKDGTTSFAQFTSTILVFDENPKALNEKVRAVGRILRAKEFTFAEEYYNNVDSWLGSLPGHSKNIRRHILSTFNIADIISTGKLWRGGKFNPSQYFPEKTPPLFLAKGQGATPFRHHRPSSSDVGHSMIIGDTGAGKSVYANFELAQWNRFRGSQGFVFDNGYSGQLLCEALGGNHYDLGKDQSIGFQPFHGLKPGNQQEIQWAVKFIQLLFSVQDVPLSPEDKATISQALHELSEMEQNDRTFSSLFVLLQDNRLKEVIKIYTRQGNYDILDSDRENISQSHHQVFELSSIEKLSNEIYLPVLMYLFHRVDKAVSPDRPTLVYVEESWQAFKNPIFAQYLKEKLLTWRKYNAHLSLVVHKPSQLIQLPDSDIFIDSCPDKIFLPNPDATADDNIQAYKRFGLTDADLDIISKAQAKKEYYIKTPEGAALIDLQLDPVTLSFITDSSGLDMAARQDKIKALQEQYGDAWGAHWLRFLGHEEAAERFFEIQNRYKDDSIPVSAENKTYPE